MLGLMIVLLYLLLLSGYLERGTAIQKFCFNKKPEKKTMLVRRETMLIVWQRALSGKNSFDGCIDIREIKGDRYIQALLSLVVKYFHKGAYNRSFPCMEATSPYAIKNQLKAPKESIIGALRKIFHN